MKRWRELSFWEIVGIIVIGSLVLWLFWDVLRHRDTLLHAGVLSLPAVGVLLTILVPAVDKAWWSFVKAIPGRWLLKNAIALGCVATVWALLLRWAGV